MGLVGCGGVVVVVVVVAADVGRLTSEYTLLPHKQVIYHIFTDPTILGVESVSTRQIPSSVAPSISHISISTLFPSSSSPTLPGQRRMPTTQLDPAYLAVSLPSCPSSSPARLANTIMTWGSATSPDESSTPPSLGKKRGANRDIQYWNVSMSGLSVIVDSSSELNSVSHAMDRTTSFAPLVRACVANSQAL
ncbi:uncharacterized protein TERG_12079 [Trichophyton rubrum CBS 118892]|uniref:Uncharacterized protein n=1 Tax=Trichophyton rubrum (strain ATCC MYA-4607 / CBS 118892) TaxID=559305 RepID=A0A080WIY8_TRIRC|nr:uncharacterized protein TERG_12079 [Trichophyton rubrum CBS 118892]KFL61404.1 hypothetical protein TERG_12079 [Trichophyton rubrum CBS 118892]